MYGGEKKMIGGIIIGVCFGVSIMLATLTGQRYVWPNIRYNEYVNWYKIGRVKQIAEEQQIDLGKLMKEDLFFRSKHLNQDFKEAMEEKLMRDLGNVEELKKKEEKKK